MNPQFFPASSFLPRLLQRINFRMLWTSSGETFNPFDICNKACLPTQVNGKRLMPAFWKFISSGWRECRDFCPELARNSKVVLLFVFNMEMLAWCGIQTSALCDWNKIFAERNYNENLTSPTSQSLVTVLRAFRCQPTTPAPAQVTGERKAPQSHAIWRSLVLTLVFIAKSATRWDFSKFLVTIKPAA